MPIAFILFACLGVFASPVVDVSICRYTVRDVGFVDLGGERFRFLVDPGSRTDGAWATTARRILASSFLDVNVEARLIRPGEEDRRTVAAVRTKRGDGVTTGGGLDPVAYLIAPDGRALAVPLPVDKTELADAGWNAIDAVASSTGRERLVGKLVDHHAVILHVVGRDGDETRRVRTRITEATTEFDAERGKLPKPAPNGAASIDVAMADRATEAAFLFSLGIDVADAGDHVVVLYGRGRRMGDVMTGGAITRTAIREALFLVGQDCECELDRRYFDKVGIPLRWDDDVRQRAADLLGFVPESPMVRSEVSRIVVRGGQGSVTARGFDLDGYREEVVGAEAGLANDVTSIDPSKRDAEKSPADEEAEAASAGDDTTRSDEAGGSDRQWGGRIARPGDLDEHPSLSLRNTLIVLTCVLGVAVLITVIRWSGASR